MKRPLSIILILCCTAFLCGCDKSDPEKSAVQLLSDGIWRSEDGRFTICFQPYDKKEGTSYGLIVPGGRNYADAFEMDISSTDFGPYSIELKYLKFDRVTRQYTTYDSENESLTAVIDGDLMNVVVLMGNNYFKGVKNITFHREERGDYYASNMLLPAIWDFSPQTEYGYGYYQPVYIFGAPEDVVAYFPDTVNDSLIPSFLSGKPVVEKKKDPGILFHHDPKKGKFTADIVDYDSIHDGFTVLETVSFTVKNENNLKNITVKFPEQILKHIWLDSRPTFHNPSYGTPPVDY